MIGEAWQCREGFQTTATFEVCLLVVISQVNCVFFPLIECGTANFAVVDSFGTHSDGFLTTTGFRSYFNTHQ